MFKVIRSLSFLFAALLLTTVVTATVCQTIHSQFHKAQDPSEGPSAPLHTVLCNWVCHISHLTATAQTSAFPGESLVKTWSPLFLFSALLSSLTVRLITSARAPPSSFVLSSL
ncbi:MAG: hypothetical protein OEY91_06280 [Nitrospirota bacterium]|nr:hypothetical protein [Nitrospirota bacterium]